MRAARWAALLAGVVLALVYLNSAAYSAWAGGGPPSAAPEAWMHRAFAHLCYGVAAALGGVILFKVIRSPPRLDRAALALLIVGGIFIAAPSVRHFLLVDGCLDSGGRWDTAVFRCER